MAQTALERIAAYTLDFVESLDKGFIKVVVSRLTVLRVPIRNCSAIQVRGTVVSRFTARATSTLRSST